MRFIAESEDAVIAAIRAGMVPDGVLHAPARVAHDAHGVSIEPTKTIPDDARRELEGLGFRTEETPIAESRTVESWPQIIAPRRGREPLPELGHALFVAPRRGFADLIGTLLRLGADRQEVAFFEGELCATKVVEPPYYVALSAAEGGEVRGYCELEGNPRVWMELGWEHPLASFFVVPEGELLLIGERWTRIHDGPWRSIYSHLELGIPGARTLAAVESDLRLEVRLRLVPATTHDTPKLWILREPRLLDSLVGSMPEAALRAFAFARLETDNGDPLVALRARVGHDAAPLELPEAEAYLSVRDVDNLFAPRGTAIYPPLRRERLRESLAPDVDALSWLVPVDDEGSFRVEHAPASAFAPLTEWVDHVAAENAVALQPWLDAAIFELDDFVGVEVTAAAPTPKPTPTSKKPAEKAPRTTQTRLPSAPAPSRELRSEPLAVETSVPTALQREIEEVEARLIDLLGGNNVYRTPTRDDMVPDWRLLGALYAEAGRTNDAALAFAQALWMLEPTEGQWRQVLRRWVDAESAPARFDAERVRGELVRALYALAREQAVDVAATRALLDANSDAIPTRLAWLVQETLARHTQDQLGFVRAQDAMRVRLRGGLRVTDDVLGFIRYFGQEMSGQARLVDALVDTRAAYEATPRNRSDTEAARELTDGYVAWIFSWGFAQLGDSPRSLDAAKAADIALAGADDAIHEYLRAAFRARVEQARTGRGLHAALPFELHAQLEALPRMDRYKVDRLREASTVLEGGAVDAFGAFRDAERLEITEPGNLAAQVDEAIAAGDATSLGRAGALLQLMPPYDALPRMEAFITALLSQPQSAWPSLLDDALLVVSTARNFALQRNCIDALLRVVVEAEPDAARAAARALGRHATAVAPYRYNRAAEKVRERLDELSHDALAHLELATLLSTLGDASELAAAAEKAVTIRRPRDWLAWHRRHALALARISPEHAIQGTREAMKSLERVTDRFQTNSHFCLSVLHFMESMVLGLARADLAIAPQARRIIDADEHLVRQRIFARPFMENAT